MCQRHAIEPQAGAAAYCTTADRGNHTWIPNNACKQAAAHSGS